jgi:hypothetical protein
MLSRSHKFYRVICWNIVLLGAVFGLGLPCTASAQVEKLLDTATVESSIEHRFRLSDKDMKALRPMIRRESEIMVLILGRFEDRADDYLGLWNKVRISRREFESEPRNSLSRRQQQALRAVRADFEIIVLDQWREDYVQQIADLLELDSIQSELFAKVFELEQHERLRLLTSKLLNNREVDSKWRELTNQREKSVERILDPMQLRDYLLLTKPVERLIA